MMYEKESNMKPFNEHVLRTTLCFPPGVMDKMKKEAKKLRMSVSGYLTHLFEKETKGKKSDH